MSSVTSVAGKSSPVLREDARTKALAKLRQSVWEASQFLDRRATEKYVGDVLNEIQSDEL